MGASLNGGMYISSSAQIADGVVAAADLALPTTKGGLIAHNGTNPTELAVGTNDYILMADSTETTGLKWTTSSALAGYGSPYTLFLSKPDSVVQGTWTASISGTRAGAVLMTNNTGPATADEITIKIYLSAGTYTFNTYCETNNHCGILKYIVDGTAVATQDLYTGGSVYGVVQTTGCTIATSGLKTMSIKVDGKNGSSSNYIVYLSVVEIKRTA